tara:strand:+ start:277 stop:615 length:339 start_codon:yes stop_codon:yes gene_type:complete
MPFALIPEGFKLQKVTKAQQQAIDKFNSNKNTQAFFEGPASSELVKAVAIVVTPIVLAVLAKRGVELAQEEITDIVKTTTAAAGGIISEDRIIEIAKFIFDFTDAGKPFGIQ